MNNIRQKIPLILKFKRAKNSPVINSINNLLSILKPNKYFNGIPQKILFIRNDKIGDAVVTLPVLRNIKLNYPEIELDILVSGKNKFVFDNLNFVDETIQFDWVPEGLHKFYTLPLFGSILQFLHFCVFKYFSNEKFRELIKFLREKKYDVVIDLVGLKRNIVLGKMISNYIIGPKKFGVYIFYNFYAESNWVVLNDTDFMSTKIQNVIQKALNFTFRKTSDSIPIIASSLQNRYQNFDVVFHLGSSPLRKLSHKKEAELLESFKGYKVLVTDKGNLDNFNQLKLNLVKTSGFQFKTFDSLKEIASVCSNSKILICYDGGQAHYLSQFIRTVTIFGPGMVDLWKPYEFSSYKLLEENSDGVKAIISEGQYKHIVIYYPIWCRPCFDIGCNDATCLTMIRPEFVKYIVSKYCL